MIAIWLSLEGVLDASGQSGFGGGGGGSGGAVSITAEIFVGTGAVKSNGGDGGYGGGLVAGGGGGGGRIAVTSSRYVFSGSLFSKGGFRPETYDTEATSAGAGTIWMLISNGTFNVNAVVISSIGVTNYSINLFRKEGIYLPSTVQSTFPACIPDSFSDVDIHALGNSPVALSGESIKLTAIVASGYPTISVVSGSQLNFSTSFRVVGFQLEFLNCSIASQASIYISAGGTALLRPTSSTFGAPLSHYVFASLFVLDGGTLYGKDSVVYAANILIQECTFHIENSFGIVVASAQVSSASFIGLSTLSSLLWESNSTSVSGNMTLYNMIFVAKGSIILNGTVYSPFNGVFQLSAGSELFAKQNPEFGADLYSSGKIIIDYGASLTLNGYGECLPTCSFELLNSSTLVFSGFFVFGLDGMIFGNGSVLVSGSLSPPQFMPTTPAVLIGDTGTLLLNESSANYSILTSNFLVFGTLEAMSTVGVQNLNCSGSISVFTNGTLNVYSNMILNGGCLISGTGPIVVSWNATMLCAIAAPDVTISNANIVNYGSIYASGGSINFAQNSYVSNYGNIIFNGQTWSSSVGLSSFKKYPSVDSVGDFGARTILNTSLEICSAICLENMLPVERYASPLPDTVDYFSCQAFEYITRLNFCRLHVKPPVFTETAFIDPFAADLYVRVSTWAFPSILTNHGNITVDSGSFGVLDLHFVNHAATIIPTNSELTVSDTYEQSGSSEILGGGTIFFSGAVSHLNRSINSSDLLMNISGKLYITSP